jgi:hypothetical protein
MKTINKKLFADEGLTRIEIEEHFSTDEMARK